MKDKTKQEFGELFIKSFIGSVISSLKKPEYEEAHKKVITEEYISTPPIEANFQALPLGIEKPFKKEIMMEIPIQQQKFITQNPPFNYNQINSIQKIMNLLGNYTISSIECPGPGKNLIAHKGNLIQTLPVFLSQGEIEQIIEYFAEKTRIPLIKGTFRATMQNLMITALISDFIGTRFYIEKKRPVMHPPRHF